ncbi:MAG: hypothetical protein HYY66_05805 [Candidatus Tectomicrobia bacterium]|nr:hypothetical protein [Candidatus Tectomicrobia bacterium]
MTLAFRLRFPADKIQPLAERYWKYSKETERNREKEIEEKIEPKVRERRYYTRSEFLVLARWKSQRPLKHYKKNSEEYVQEVTRIALSSSNERIRVGSLMLLDGVSWPVASVLPHFGVRDRYPILDFRALWSLKVKVPKQYDFPFWWAYTLHCRCLADEHKVSMRTLDRALWQHSKEKQGEDSS